MQPRLLRLAFLIVFCGFCACNTTDGARFSDQTKDYVFASTSTHLTAYGAYRIEDSEGEVFRCPSISGLGRESDMTSFHARATSANPSFSIESIQGVRGDSSNPLGIALYDLPMGLLDVYQRCASGASEKYVTSCPSSYTIVDACDPTSTANTCALIYEGTHRLVISAMMDGDDSCYTEESDRSRYNLSAPDIVYACDDYAPRVVHAAYRGPTPSNDCCEVSTQSHVDFCVKPCGCRKLDLRIELKAPPASQPENTTSIKLAVFSNVDGNREKFGALLDSIATHKVDHVISLGGLTRSGSIKDFSIFRNIIDEKLRSLDGQNCPQNDQLICCKDPGTRTYTSFCNAVTQKTAFWAGLGENEKDGTGLERYRKLFGTSYASTIMGKVQLIMLDSADAKLSQLQHKWLTDTLTTPKPQSCEIPEASNGNWPSLGECEQMIGGPEGSKKITCRECIAQEALCIPPQAERSKPELGPLNCICVPATSKICKYSQYCPSYGKADTCRCSRDGDCLAGGSCIDGVCAPPLRLIFSYTPLFDEYGSRNNAFLSREEAASLLSLFIDADVKAIFSGRIMDYAKYQKAKIDFYITGGGGAPMTAFARKKHHWLLVEIPNAYSAPKAEDMRVEVIEF